MFQSQRNVLLLRQQTSRLDNILDLSPIDLMISRQGLEVRITQATTTTTSIAMLCIVRSAHATDERLPDVQPTRDVQGWVVDDEMNTRFKCGVDVVEAVGGKEHDTLVVLEFLQEGWVKGRF